MAAGLVAAGALMLALHVTLLRPMHRLQREMADIHGGSAEARVSDPSIAADHQKMAAACADLDRAQATVTSLYARWQELESKRGQADRTPQ